MDAPEDDVKYYDFEVSSKEIFNMYLEMNKIEVFGEGLQKPVIKLNASITEAKAIGQDKTHLSCKADNDIKCIGFSLAEQYEELNKPEKATLYGVLSTNWWRGSPIMQLQVNDLN